MVRQTFPGRAQALRQRLSALAPALVAAAALAAAGPARAAMNFAPLRRCKAARRRMPNRACRRSSRASMRI